MNADWFNQVASAALSSKETLRATYDIARLALQNSIPGDFVECGVFAGAQCAMMARAIMDHHCDDELEMWCPAMANFANRVHLFDSFEGVPPPGIHDVDWRAARHPVGQSACSLEEVHVNMEAWGIYPKLLIKHVGRFNYTVHLAANAGGLLACNGLLRGIAILRLDCDLYEWTKVCLENLYPLVSPGGWVIVDDMALDGCKKAVDDFMKGQKDGYPPIYFQKR